MTATTRQLMTLKKNNSMNDEQIDALVEKKLTDMMADAPAQLITFFLSILAKEMESANAATMNLSCHLTINNKRYKIETKSKLKALNKEQ